MQSHDSRTEAALYWSAVSLIVCEGLPIDKAAEQLGVDGAELREIMQRRQLSRPFADSSPPVSDSIKPDSIKPFVRH